MAPALHKMELTDGEFAAVKGYRASMASTWLAFDKRVARAVDMAILHKGGMAPAKIAGRYKRTRAPAVVELVKQAGAILAEYDKRPRSTWPPKVAKLAALIRPAKDKDSANGR